METHMVSPAPTQSRPGHATPTTLRPAVFLPPAWVKKVLADPARWTGPAFETFDTDTIALTMPGDGHVCALSYSPLARDLVQSDLLDMPVAQAYEYIGYGDIARQRGSAHTQTRTLASAALNIVLGDVGAAALKREVSRACTLVSCIGMAAGDTPELDLLRITRRVFYSTMLSALVPGSAGADVPSILGLCDTIASAPINPITSDPVGFDAKRSKKEPPSAGARLALNAHWTAALMDSDGVIPRIYRDPALFALPDGLIDSVHRERYFASFLTSLLLSVEPVAKAAASTLEYSLRGGFLDPRPEFPGVIRRSPPVSFITREVRDREVFAGDRREVQIAPNLALRSGDRLVLHLPSIFDHDPHAPYQDAFGVGAHRCIGSAVATAFLRASLEPLFKALCSMMAAPTSTPGIVSLDLVTVARLRAAMKRAPALPAPSSPPVPVVPLQAQIPSPPTVLVPSWPQTWP